MPAPTNTSAATAIDLGTLPCDVSQDVHDAGTTYTVWYKFTAPANSRVIGAWGWAGSAGAAYQPTIYPFSDAGFTNVLGIAAQNKPIQFPVTAGNQYWLRFTTNGGNPTPAVLRIRCEVAPVTTISRGNIIVNDDTEGFPLAVLDHTADYSVINFVNGMPAGEAGDIIHALPIRMILSDEFTVPEFVLLDENFAVLAHIPYLNGGNPKVRANQVTQQFYIGNEGSGATNAQFRTCSRAGVLGGVVTLTHGLGMDALAPNISDTILYFSQQINAPIRRWDIVGGSMMSDFVAAVAGYVTPDILVLNDDTVIISFWNLTTQDFYIKHYSTAGAELHTYSLGSAWNSTLPRLAHALDNPDSFWVFTHPTSANGSSQFLNIRVSDGVTVTTRLQAEYEGGAYQPAVTDPPLSRFGNSFSCPFFIFNAATSPSGLYVIVPNKRNDNDLAIPTPIFKTALMP